MQRLAEVKRRIKSVRGIGEVCQTLATVASAKLSQTRQRAAGSRAYVGRVRAMIARQQRAAAEEGFETGLLSPLLRVRPVARALVIVIGSDRGLCGGYNLALCRSADAFLTDLAAPGVEVDLVVKGRKVERYLTRVSHRSISQASGWTREGVTAGEVDSALKVAVDAFIGGDVDEVWAYYTDFVTLARREPVSVRLLPIASLEVVSDADASDSGWSYESSRDACVEELLGVLVRAQVENVLLSAFASEQAARMVTMQEAAERADRSLAQLVVRHNRIRREEITSDLVGVLVAARLRGGEQDGS